MKKLVLVLAIFSSSIIFGQLRFNESEFLTTSVTVNPISVFDKTQNFTTIELEYNAPNVYVRAAVKTMQGQEYFDWGGVIGTSLQNDKVRLYTGLKLGTVIVDSRHYALTGLEAGIDFSSCNRLTLGARVTFDYVAHYNNYIQPVVVLKYRIFTKK